MTVESKPREPPCPREYTCDACGNTYHSGRSEEDARAETRANGWDPDNDCGVVCDDCYRKVMASLGRA